MATKLTYVSSLGVRNIKAFPELPILAVLPQRWTKELIVKKYFILLVNAANTFDSFIEIFAFLL